MIFYALGNFFENGGCFIIVKLFLIGSVSMGYCKTYSYVQC